MPKTSRLHYLIFEFMIRAKHISESITAQDFRLAILSAAQGHNKREEVKYAIEHLEEESRRLYEAYKDKSCHKLIAYRKMKKTNNNGKQRLIDSPSWETRVYQHLIINKLLPIYNSKDNLNGLNCKSGCGITASDKRKSVLHFMKHIYYDRLDLQYAVIADQRKCYEHLSATTFRRALRLIVEDKDFVDFATAFTIVDGKMPIGTPTSPLAHHIIMLEFDIFVKEISPESIRYADDNAISVHDLREANEIKWRIKNFWWYKLGIRAKRHTIRIVPLTKPLDFCGYILHRGGGGHCKGYVGLRGSILKRARHATARNWGSYFGILQHADLYREMQRIERKMKLSQLTNKIKLTRHLDAPNIPIRDIVGVTITVVDYELRCDKDGNPDWVKMLIGIPEEDGRLRAGEIHGSYQWLVAFLHEAEMMYGKDTLLPIEDVVIDNQCGYIFKESTNQIKYFDDEEK